MQTKNPKNSNKRRGIEKEVSDRTLSVGTLCQKAFGIQTGVTKVVLKPHVAPSLHHQGSVLCYQDGPGSSSFNNSFIDI